MDALRFAKACEEAEQASPSDKGIGTLSEKTLHAVLKRYYEPHGDNHEVKIGGYVADIVGEHGIIEIQTRNFDRLRTKLAAFLPAARTTVVYPAVGLKWLCWVDKDTGEVTNRRKSPRKGGLYDVIPELYKIKAQLFHPNLQIAVPVIELTEYRYLDGWSGDRKKGSTRCERIPQALMAEYRLSGREDYRQFLPGTLPEEFDSAEFAKAANIRRPLAQTTLLLLTLAEVVQRVGKRKNAYVYRVL